MRDEDDLHEPEHDHLLDHEFHYDDDQMPEADAQGAEDEIEEEALLDDLDDDDRDHPAWHDDCEDD
ncbi:hypothetical protein D3C76_465910 [compost metagenome]|jgi:hypothetical protein